MQKKYESEYCNVSYIEEKNLVFVEWKKYCEFDTYRKPLMIALQVIKEYKCDYVADTRNGFEDNPEDTWAKNCRMITSALYASIPRLILRKQRGNPHDNKQVVRCT